MKETLKKIWDEYLFDECCLFSTDEERSIMKKTAELHEKTSASLTREQDTAVCEYIDSLLELESAFARKAFCKGCKFGASFIMEVFDLKVR